MKVIAFANQKGGVAKTTTTLNLAVAFAEAGHRVLAVDMDPQGNLTMSQGIDPDTVEKSMYHVLVDNLPIREVIRKREVDVACASIDLAGAEIAMSTKIGRERSLEKALKAVRDDYDFVCIDTPPSLGLLTINALTAADKVIVPVQCEYLSMRGLIQLQNTLSMIREELNPDVEIEGILPTLVDARTVHAKEAIEILEENFGDRVFATRIRKTIRFAEAPVKGTSVLKYDPDGWRPSPTETLRRRFLNMAGGKRASMREGPLAALFRRTDEDAPARSQQSSGRAEPSAPPRRQEAAARATEQDRYARQRSQRAPLPSPKERLSAAFSQDIPHNVMERPGEPPARVPPARRAARSPRVAVHQPVLRVVGVGGGGVNAVNRMVEAGVEGVEFIAVNTDAQSLQQSAAHVTLHIGVDITRGLGSGLRPEGRPRLRDLGRRPHQDASEGIRHGLRRRRIGRRHGHGRGAGRRAHRAGGRRAHRRHRHQAVRLRGHASCRARPTTA